MQVQGGCHCGYITFEADVDPELVRICHCTDCQQLTGSAFRVNVNVPKSKFKLLSGTPKTYIKTAESGNKRAHGFCPECGTPIYSTSPGPDPDSYGLRVGTIKQRAQLQPKKMGWFRSALPWALNIEALPHTQKNL